AHCAPLALRRSLRSVRAGCPAANTNYNLISPEDPGRIIRMAQATTPPPRRRGVTLTQQIFIGLILGIIVGAIVDATHPEYAIYFRPFSQLFLRLIKMVIAPLIFATLVA